MRASGSATAWQCLAGDPVVGALILIEPMRIAGILAEEGLRVFLESEVTAVEVLGMSDTGQRGDPRDRGNYACDSETAVHEHLLRSKRTVSFDRRSNPPPQPETVGQTTDSEDA